MACYAIMGLVVKPILLIKIVDYKWSDIWFVIWPCLRVIVLALPIPTFTSIYLSKIALPQVVSFFLIVSVCVLSVATVVWLFGLTTTMREKLLVTVKTKLHRK